MALPTREEINVDDDLDGRVACEHFLGKNLDDAEALFRENPGYYQSDLMWMGPVAFRYYVQAAIRFIQGESDTGQSEIICDFAGTLESRLEHESAELTPIAKELAAICGYIVDHYDRLGDLPKTEEQAHALAELLRKEFAKHKQSLGDDFLSSHKPDDYIDLRPRYKVLRQAFSDLARKGFNPK